MNIVRASIEIKRDISLLPLRWGSKIYFFSKSLSFRCAEWISWSMQYLLFNCETRKVISVSTFLFNYT